MWEEWEVRGRWAVLEDVRAGKKCDSVEGWGIPMLFTI